MSTVTERNIWIEGDTACEDPLIDNVTNAAPWAWRGNNLKVNVALFETKGAALYEVTNLAQLRLAIKDNLSSSVPALVELSVLAAALTDDLDIADWYGFTDQHAEFEFSRAQMNIPMAGAEQKQLWIVLLGITTDATPKEICFGIGRFTLKDDGLDGSLPIAESQDPDEYWVDGKHYVWDYGTATYRRLIHRNGTTEYIDA